MWGPILKFHSKVRISLDDPDSLNPISIRYFIYVRLFQSIRRSQNPISLIIETNKPLRIPNSLTLNPNYKNK